MSGKDPCDKLRDELRNLKELRGQLGSALVRANKSRIFDGCRYLREEMMQLLNGPDSEISKIRMPEALKKLKLKEQYESQVKVAEKSGLYEEKPVLMDYEDNEWRGSYLTESYNIALGSVPLVEWRRNDRQIYLGRLIPDAQSGDYGVRPSVNIK